MVGAYSNLCRGTWTLKRDGEVLDIDIPFNGEDDKRGTDAGTYGTYTSWYFGENWQVLEEDYEDGYDMGTWMVVNEEWLSSFAPRQEWPDIYNAFS